MSLCHVTEAKMYRCASVTACSISMPGLLSHPLYGGMLQSGGVEVSKLPPSLIAAAQHPAEPQVSAGMVSSQHPTQSHFDGAANGIGQSGLSSLSGIAAMETAAAVEAAALAAGLPQTHV